MIETKDLILDKAKFSDWEGMYHNVWSHPESTRYMLWKVTASESDARIRIQKNIEYQKNNDAWLIYEKATGQPIGFAGVEKIAPTIYEETGICLGPDYVGKGFGKQVLQALIQYCRENFGATEFLYSTREKNEVSNRLAISQGFTFIASEPKIDSRDGQPYNLLKYSLKL